MCSSASFGLGSNVSMWLGPPSMNRQMQAFALAAWCAGFGESGPAAVLKPPSAHSSELNAAVPSDRPRPYRKSRREGEQQGIGVNRTCETRVKLISAIQIIANTK